MTKKKEMKDSFIPNKRTLYLVRFPGWGLYGTGPQGDVPGGLIAYFDREMAQQAADAIGGGVEARSLLAAIEFCRKKHLVLYIRYADGGTGYIAETVPDVPNEQALIRVEGTERERLIEVARQQGAAR